MRAKLPDIWTKIMKICSKCHIEKDNSSFSKEKRAKSGLRSECKSCKAKSDNKWYKLNPNKAKEWASANPEKKVNIHLKYRYNISLELYNKMLADQNNLCKVCNKLETAITSGGIIRRLAVDHDHNTGKIRGLLCGKCNNAYGLLGEDEKTILGLLNYHREFYLD